MPSSQEMDRAYSTSPPSHLGHNAVRCMSLDCCTQSPAARHGHTVFTTVDDPVQERRLRWLRHVKRTSDDNEHETSATLDTGRKKKTWSATSDLATCDQQRHCEGRIVLGGSIVVGCRLKRVQEMYQPMCSSRGGLRSIVKIIAPLTSLESHINKQKCRISKLSAKIPG